MRVVTETAPLIRDKTWLNTFGDLLMMQEPNKNDHQLQMDVDFNNSYGFLMLFTDGNRVDLRILTKERMLVEYTKDTLTVPLVDKDAILPKIPPPTDRMYHVKNPSEGEYDSCTNEFWWCLQNVAKGIWRDEIPYAKQMYERTTRKPLDKMVFWWIGMKHNFHVSTGKFGKYFKRYLPKSCWEMYEKTYSNAGPQNMWESIFITCELFRNLAQDVAEYFNFNYPLQDDQNMTIYLKRIRELPPDAKEIFSSENEK